MPFRPMRVLIFASFILKLIATSTSNKTDNFLDFWRDADFFAYQIRRSIKNQPRTMKRSFRRSYNSLRRELMKFYNPEKCELHRLEYNLTEWRSEKTYPKFDVKLSPFMNTVYLRLMTFYWMDSFVLLLVGHKGNTVQ